MARRVKEKIRQIWLINTLLDCEKWKQQDLRDELISNTTLSLEMIDKNEKKKLDKKISKALGILEIEGVIKRENDPNTRDKYCWLVSDTKEVPTALTKILELYKSTELNSNELEHKFSSSMKNKFMASKYANKVIQRSLVNKIESSLGIELDEKEKEKVLFILQVSPTSLITTLQLLDTPWDMVKPSMVKDFFLSKLKETILTDTKKDYYYPPYPIMVEYEQKLSIKNCNTNEVFNLTNEPVTKTLTTKKINSKIQYEPTDELSPL